MGDLSLDERRIESIKMYLMEIESGSGERIQLLQDMVQWRGVVNAVTNVRINHEAGTFFA
jgi:hypothetical protein